MEIITIENSAFSSLIKNLEQLIEVINESNLNQKSNEKKSAQKSPRHKLEDQWLDNEEVCRLLRVTKRTLQNYRDKFLIPYSQVGKKTLYKKEDVQKLLEKHYYAVE